VALRKLVDDHAGWAHEAVAQAVSPPELLQHHPVGLRLIALVAEGFVELGIESPTDGIDDLEAARLKEIAELTVHHRKTIHDPFGGLVNARRVES
jgi:hypothetical protein